jgi:prolyl 4-hydroxylase
MFTATNHTTDAVEGNAVAAEHSPPAQMISIAPSAASTKPLSLPPCWVRWLIEGTEKGCTGVSLVQAMCDKGFDAAFAELAVVVCHDLLARGRQGAAAEHLWLPAKWQDWLLENIERGCDDLSITATLRASGFDQWVASALPVVVRAFQMRPDAALGTVVAPAAFRPDPIRLPAQGQFDFEGHRLGIGFVMRSPAVALIEHVLSDAECDELIERSRPRLQRSGVVDRDSGASVVSKVRTSTGTHFERGDGETIARIERRLARLIDLPIERFEPIQILQYQPGHEYRAHQDYFEPDDPGSRVQTPRGGNRIASFVIYLNTVPEGGETHFPDLGLSVRARRGAAVYFEYMNARSELDPRCLHAGRPVLKGEKWIATKWVRVGRY